MEIPDLMEVEAVEKVELWLVVQVEVEEVEL